MKPVLPLIIFLCSIQLDGQNAYTAAGYSPRILLSSSLDNVLDLYENTLIDVTDSLDDISFMHGFTIRRGVQLDKMIYHLGINFFFTNHYGEATHPTAGATTLKAEYKYITFLGDVAFPLLEKNYFLLLAGAGLEVSGEFIYIDITNNGFYGEYIGPADNNFNYGVSVYGQAMYDFDSFVGVIRPFYTLNLVRNQYGELYEKISTTPLEVSFDERISFFGVELLVAAWDLDR